ncbi:heterokaryon incompatibility protein-domain-containing protein, partial [Colletotrichum godetiae]
ALAQPKSWIQDCKHKHTECNMIAIDSKWYPTRLIDVGPLEMSENAETPCRLVNTSDESIGGPYLTLSHCWGEAKSLILTKSNAAQFHKSIASDDLPLLYSEAVKVAKELGIRYLWIDALCIIQEGDDFADWRHESTLMDKVYSHAFCNISAMSAKDSEDCLFSNRNSEASQLPVIWRDVEGRASPAFLVDAHFWSSEVRGALVNTRAWVLQELLLSRRILFIGERQVLWHCRSTREAEVWPPNTPIDDVTELGRIEDLPLGCGSARHKPNDRRNAYLCWHDIVSRYTRCKISFPSDRLIALSAVAKEMMPVLEDEYVAGMWRRHLESELIWWSFFPFEPSPSPSDQLYRAPSWSWASAETEVVPGRPYKDCKVDRFIEVEDFHLEHVTGDTTGLVSEGWLRLWGRLKQIKLSPSGDWRPEGHREAWKMVSRVKRQDGTLWSVRLDKFHDNFDEQNAKSTLYCMPAELESWEAGKSSFGAEAYEYLYVVLLELQDERRGVFRRLGVASAYGAAGETKNSVLAREEGDGKFSCEEYRDGKHLIRII